LSNLPYPRKSGREINRRLPEVERVSDNSGLSGDSIQRVVQPTVTDDGEKALAFKFGCLSARQGILGKPRYILSDLDQNRRLVPRLRGGSTIPG
jgi:hypothetical protein